MGKREVQKETRNAVCESISKVLEIPLFDDSPQIRTVHKDIKRSRDQILAVANLLTGGIIEEVEEEQ